MTPSDGTGTPPPVAVLDGTERGEPEAPQAPKNEAVPATSNAGAGPRPAVVAAAALLVGAVIGFFGRPATPQENRFVNFDPESTPTDVLVRGWSNFESSPATGDTFTWCAAQSCALRVQIRPEGDRTIRVRLSAFKFPDAPDQTLTIFVNDTPIGTQPVSGEMKIVQFKAPRAAWHSGLNEVRFDFAYAMSPKSKFPTADDPRTLSAAFDWVEFANQAP
jgi:hypothetical protein